MEVDIKEEDEEEEEESYYMIVVRPTFKKFKKSGLDSNIIHSVEVDVHTVDFCEPKDLPRKRATIKAEVPTKEIETEALGEKENEAPPVTLKRRGRPPKIKAEPVSPQATNLETEIDDNRVLSPSHLDNKNQKVTPAPPTRCTRASIDAKKKTQAKTKGNRLVKPKPKVRISGVRGANACRRVTRSLGLDKRTTRTKQGVQSNKTKAKFHAIKGNKGIRNKQFKANGSAPSEEASSLPSASEKRKLSKVERTVKAEPVDSDPEINCGTVVVVANDKFCPPSPRKSRKTSQILSNNDNEQTVCLVNDNNTNKKSSERNTRHGHRHHAKKRLKRLKRKENKIKMANENGGTVDLPTSSKGPSSILKVHGGISIMQNKIRRKLFKCSHCRVQYKKSKETFNCLKRHGLYMCKICFKVLPMIEQNGHDISSGHLNTDTGEWQCLYCDKVYRSNVDIKIHIGLIHLSKPIEYKTKRGDKESSGSGLELNGADENSLPSPNPLLMIENGSLPHIPEISQAPNNAVISQDQVIAETRKEGKGIGEIKPSFNPLDLLSRVKQEPSKFSPFKFLPVESSIILCPKDIIKPEVENVNQKRTTTFNSLKRLAACGFCGTSSNSLSVGFPKMKLSSMMDIDYGDIGEMGSIDPNSTSKMLKNSPPKSLPDPIVPAQESHNEIVTGQFDEENLAFKEKESSSLSIQANLDLNPDSQLTKDTRSEITILDSSNCSSPSLSVYSSASLVPSVPDISDLITLTSSPSIKSTEKFNVLIENRNHNDIGHATPESSSFCEDENLDFIPSYSPNTKTDNNFIELQNELNDKVTIQENKEDIETETKGLLEQDIPGTSLPLFENVGGDELLYSDDVTDVPGEEPCQTDGDFTTNQSWEENSKVNSNSEDPGNTLQNESMIEDTEIIDPFAPKCCFCGLSVKSIMELMTHNDICEKKELSKQLECYYYFTSEPKPAALCKVCNHDFKTLPFPVLLEHVDVCIRDHGILKPLVAYGSESSDEDDQDESQRTDQDKGRATLIPNINGKLINGLSSIVFNY